MLYKEDIDEARAGLTAWWCREDPGRPVLGFKAPRDKPLPGVPVPPMPQDAAGIHLDMDWVLSTQENVFAANRYFGDLVPYFDTNIGPGSLAVYLGSEPHFDPGTVWYEPCIDPEDPEGTPLVARNPDSPWWRRHLDMVRTAAGWARGKCLASIPDLIEGLDILASFRGTGPLLLDLYDRPAWVKLWLERIEQVYFDYFEPMYELVRDETGGCAFTAFHIWAPGRMAKVQCDFAYMIGPGMFREFVVPALARQCGKLAHSVFHLDGPMCIQHVQHLVEIEGLDAVQWTPGAGNPGVGDECWDDLYRQVLDGGKGLLLIGLSAEQARRIVGEFGRRGIFFVLHDVGSEAEGEDLLESARDW